MTKQSVVVPEAMAPSPAPLFPYPPSRVARGGKCAAQAQMELVGGWVESMRASSPTHARADDRASWLADHPSALAKFEQVVAASRGKQIVVFLDYDGTLSPIVDDPDAAYMSDTMRRAVRSVARHFPTAIVSGRCRDKVFEFVQLAELYYAGSHGMDITGPAKSARHTRAAKAKGVLFQPASQFLPLMHQHAGARIFGGEDPVHPRSQGGEQQVLRVGPLSMRGREVVGHGGGDGEGGGAGAPGAEGDAGEEGAGGAAEHRVGQGQGAGVPPRVARFRGPRRRAAALRRRRPHRRGRLPGAAPPRPRRRHPRLRPPQGHQRRLLAAGPRRGHGLPAAPRRLGPPLLQASPPPPGPPPGRRPRRGGDRAIIDHKHIVVFYHVCSGN